MSNALHEFKAKTVQVMLSWGINAVLFQKHCSIFFLLSWHAFWLIFLFSTIFLKETLFTGQVNDLQIIVLVCLTNCSKILRVDRYCYCFTLALIFFFLVILFFVSFRCDLFKFLSCKSCFLISAVTDYPSSFASVGLRFLSNFFFFFCEQLIPQKKYTSNALNSKTILFLSA